MIRETSFLGMGCIFHSFFHSALIECQMCAGYCTRFWVNKVSWYGPCHWRTFSPGESFRYVGKVQGEGTKEEVAYSTSELW